MMLHIVIFDIKKQHYFCIMMISSSAMMTTLFKVKYNSIGNAGHDWTSKLSQKSKAAATSLIGLIRFVAWKN